MKRSELVLKSVAWGLYAWTAYAVVESLLAYVAYIALGFVGVFPKAGIFPGFAFGLTGTYLAFYAAAGVLSGLTAGCLLDARRRDAGWAGRGAAVLSLALVFAVNLLFATPLSRSEYMALAVAAAIVAAGAIRLNAERRPNGLRCVENPWIVSLLLLIAPWVSREFLFEGSGTMKAGAAAAALLVAGLAALTADRFRARDASAGSRLAAALATLALVLGFLWIHGQRVPALPSASAAAQPGRPNLLMIVMDTVRADHLSLYGYSRDTSPRLRELAASATLYRNPVATADFTLPTHASMFTGMYPSWHGAVYAPPDHPWGRPLNAKYPTLAETLSKQGYLSLAAAGNFAYLQPDFGLTRGFAASYAPQPVKLSTPKDSEGQWSHDDRPFYLREGVRALIGLFGSTREFDRRCLRARDINRVAENWLEGVRPGQPFFLFLNYIDAHTPYLPPAPFDTRYPGKNPKYRGPSFDILKRDVLHRKRAVPQRDLDHLLSQYDGSIAYIDSKIGELVDRLKRTGQYDNTMIVVTADHGEAFGEHSLMGHGLTSLYQDQVGVPLLIKYPHQRAGATVEEPVSQVDIMPTALVALGSTPPAHVQGRALVSPSSEPRFVLSEAHPAVHDWNPSFTRMKRAVYMGPAKLIAYESGKREFYDLGRDPKEEHNLDAQTPSVEERHAAYLGTWLKNVPRQSAAPASTKSLQMLRSLGYAQ